MYKDMNGKEIEIGSKVRVMIQGTMNITTVKKIRPRKQEIVVELGGYYISFKYVEVVS